MSITRKSVVLLLGLIALIGTYCYEILPQPVAVLLGLLAKNSCSNAGLVALTPGLTALMQALYLEC